MSDLERRSTELIAQLADGNDAALRELVELWQAPVLRFVFRYVQNEADAREIVQETFVRVHMKRRSFRAGASVSAWLFTIAANLCHNRTRWHRRHPAETLDAARRDPLVCAHPTPDRAALAEERVRAVRDAIAALPHDLKVTLLLHEYEDLSYAEIAPVVGCSMKGVEARLMRARKRLREALGSFFNDGAPKAERVNSGAMIELRSQEAR